MRVVEYALVKALGAELAAPSHEHWEIETAYDEPRTHRLRPQPILHSKTLDLVRQGVEDLMLAYHAVRTFLAETTDNKEFDLNKLFFMHAIRVVCHRPCADRVQFVYREIQPIWRSGPLDRRRCVWMHLALVPVC